MLTHYLTLASRNLLREPISTAVSVLTLSLGLVCFITAYAVVSYWQQSDGHFEKADRTHVITANLEFADAGIRTGTFPVTTMHYAKYVKAEFPELEAVARSIGAGDVSASTGEQGLRLFRMIVDPEFLDIFDLPFIAGDPRNALRQPYSVVLTQDVATGLFGDEDPMGKGLILANQIDTTVTGVIGTIPQPSHLAHVEFFASWDVREAIVRARNPDPDAPEPPENWFGGYCCTTYALLPRDGTFTAAQFAERLEGFAGRRVSPEELGTAKFVVGAVPLNGLMVAGLDSGLFGAASTYMSVTTVLFILGGLILAVACVNYANLATARAVRRARDVGLRKVVGASRRQIALQYLSEAGLLVAAALFVASLFLLLTVPVLRSTVEIDLAPTVLTAGSFYTFLIFLLGIVTLVAGAYPAFALSRVRPVEALRVGRLRSGPRFVSTLLVGTQFVAASFLLITVIVMYSQNNELRQTGLGTSTDPLLVIDNASRLTGVEPETLRTELLRVPEVLAVTAAAQPPWGPGVNLGLIDRSADSADAGHSSYLNVVGHDFFSVFDVSLLVGRVFDRERSDDVLPDWAERSTDQPIHIVIDRALAGELGFESPQAAVDEIAYFPGSPTVEGDEVSQPIRIIGVVEDRPLHFIGVGATSNFFMLGNDLEYQIVRISANDVSGALESIDEMWSRLSPAMPLSRRFLDEIFNESYGTFGRMNQLFAMLALMAFFISMVGLLGMAIQVASRRIHEIGVRKTLGAKTRQIVRMLLKDFGKPVVIANLIAWPLGYLASQIYLSVFMHRIALTPVPFIGSLLLTILIAWMAVGGQAVKAARVRPAEVLNYE